MSNMKNISTEPAFPTLDQTGNPEAWNTYFGLTKREYFAAMAMQACISRAKMMDTTQDVVEWSVKYADALLSELEKQPTP